MGGGSDGTVDARDKNDSSAGMAYHAEADQQSWDEMMAFLTEVFK